jgi:hypothetical protein
MRRFALVVVLLGLAAPLALAGGALRPIAAHGVRLDVPASWHRVRAAPAGNLIDPKTLLVVGTAGIRPRSSRCQLAAYRVPPAGALVVVVGWRSIASAGGHPGPGRGPLRRLRTVRRHELECFSGRGAGATVLLRRKVYQVSVMVGDRAPKRRIARALAVARSFRVAR